MRHPNGSQLIPGKAVTKCPCEDGRARYVILTGGRSNGYELPGYTKVRVEGQGYTINGMVNYTEAGYVFRHLTNGKNAGKMQELIGVETVTI